MQRTTIAAAAALTLFGAAASAHHGIANFDLNKDLALEGTIVSVEFLNPHSWLNLDVVENGATARWRCELRGATVLRRSGWSEDMFKAGEKISVTGSPDRREPRTCYLGTAVFADGSRVDRYGQLEPPQRVAGGTPRPVRRANGVPNLAGDWAAEQRVMTDPRGQSGTLVPLSTAREYAPGEVPGGGQGFPGARGTAISLAADPVEAYWNLRPSQLPLTEAGRRAIASFDGASRDNPRLACNPTNILFDWTFETDINRIEQTDTAIVLKYGSMGLERRIDLSGTNHPSTIAPSVAGHSIGRFEGDVLVVDTIGFAPGILTADGRVPHSGALHVVERFTLDAERMALRRDYVATDAGYFQGEYRGSDVVLISELPYHGTTECEDRTARP